MKHPIKMPVSSAQNELGDSSAAVPSPQMAMAVARMARGRTARPPKSILDANVGRRRSRAVGRRRRHSFPPVVDSVETRNRPFKHSVAEAHPVQSIVSAC